MVLWVQEHTHTHTHTLKVKAWKKVFQENGNKQTKAGAAIFTPEKTDLKDKINEQAEQKQNHRYREHSDSC